MWLGLQEVNLKWDSLPSANSSQESVSSPTIKEPRGQSRDVQQNPLPAVHLKISSFRKNNEAAIPSLGSHPIEVRGDVPRRLDLQFSHNPQRHSHLVKARFNDRRANFISSNHAEGTNQGKCSETGSQPPIIIHHETESTEKPG